MPGSATNRSLIGAGSVTSRPRPVLIWTTAFGLAATVCAADGAGAVPSIPAASATASGQPIGLDVIRISVLPPNRNLGDRGAACDPDDRASNHRLADRDAPRGIGHRLRPAFGLAGHAAALEARHVGARRIGGFARYRLARDLEQHRLFGLGIAIGHGDVRSEEQTSELQSLMRISSAG